MVLMAFGLYLTHRLVPNGRRMPYHEVGELFSMVGVLYAVLLAFALFPVTSSLWVFVGFYAVCLMVCWWFYARKGAEALS
ncbi:MULTISPECIES: hypothetical protein [unclassified Kitasatospora]|uniref:hypothetical protein n=1 Tax=unclassified Kitasatospora TaxID=2633591 RepID=UPI00070FEB1A|nr:MULTISPECIES: hypothetical protein [unclassified Kitasatospora]KQV11767.1 hypothetical protein ASC99_10020 [Kitasatospora sp. Root107]KRB76651.1 hypothetical protein ASE03_13365 [Kitasatospora sp. Root187]